MISTPFWTAFENEELICILTRWKVALPDSKKLSQINNQWTPIQSDRLIYHFGGNALLAVYYQVNTKRAS